MSTNTTAISFMNTVLMIAVNVLSMMTSMIIVMNKLSL